jgi:hypothetical protein
MKSLQSILPLVVMLLFMTSLHGQNQQQSPLPTKVIQAIKKGNASDLSPFLNTRIELILPGKSGVFSKEQAHFILKKFFSDHKISSFQVIHHGTRQNATFAIGEYNCTNEQYRMYFLIKGSNGQPLIHQIRLEKQDE